MKSLETEKLSKLDSFDEGVLFVTYKFLTKKLKSVSCTSCDSSYIPYIPASSGETENFDHLGTCQSCNKSKIAFVCTKRCKATYICNRCHSLLLAPRVKAISDWMKGGDGNGDGVLALDESHKAKIATTVTASGVCVPHTVYELHCCFLPLLLLLTICPNSSPPLLVSPQNIFLQITQPKFR